MPPRPRELSIARYRVMTLATVPLVLPFVMLTGLPPATACLLGFTVLFVVFGAIALTAPLSPFVGWMREWTGSMLYGVGVSGVFVASEWLSKVTGKHPALFMVIIGGFSLIGFLAWRKRANRQAAPRS